MNRLYKCLTHYFLVPALLLLSMAFQAQAQSTTYPVQINAHLIPPYSLYLSDYYSGTRDRLTLTLINRDQFKPTLNVRLRMTITGAGGVRMQTNDNAYIEPIIVETGAPVRLTQEDLVPYFRTDNILTQGFLTTGKLPEGTVEFCFQAFEAYTGQILSASTCTRAYITSQKPPLLSLPLNNENVSFREPLNLLFQWTPLQQGVANVEYEFILKELWDNGMAVQAAFAYSPEIYRETTRSTSLAYGAMQPALLPGKRYAWCIRAQAREGMDATNVFQNDGYSEVRVFSLQDNCAPASLVNAVAERKSLALDWPALPEHIGFTISYRLKSTNGTTNEWKEMQTLEPEGKLYGLQNGGVYEYRVGSYCVAGQPLYTEILEATIPDTDSARLAQCGIMPAINLTNQEPLKELKTSETFMANDFPVTVTKVSGSNGNYTGEGWVIIPWLNDAKIAVDFKSITINSDRQMTAGYVDAKYDKTEGGIANLDEVFEGGFDVGTVKTGITKVDHVFDFSIPGVEAFSLNDEGELVITDDDGEPHTVTADDKEGQGNEGNKVVVFPMTVKDKNGNVYQVEKVTETDPDTKETKEVAKATFIGKQRDPLSEDSFDRKQLDGGIAMVKFEKGTGVYGFDSWLDYYAKVSLIKDKYGEPMWSDGYRAPWKFLPDGKTDVVLAKIDIKDSKVITKPEEVIFITPKGTEFKSEYNKDTKTYTVNLAAGPVGDAQEVYALYAKDASSYYTLGKLSVATYATQNYTVVLVPVNNAPVDKDAIQKTLKEVYGPIAVTWTVTKDDNFVYPENYRLMEKGTGLSTYNDDMRTLNNQYRSERAGTFDKAANYLFFLKATGAEQVNDRDLTGFMPRGAQFGYIFTSEIKALAIPQTVAHELGHGRWKLFHTFDEHYGGFEREKTDNVMDYNNGIVVAKWQWDVIGDPAMLVSIFEGDDASANLFANSIPKEFLNGTTFNFLTPTGKKITLPQNCSVSFNYGIMNPDELENPIGYVYSFVLTDEKNQKLAYTASIDKGTFKGYYRNGTGELYEDKLTAKDNNANVIMFAPEATGIVYVKFKLPSVVAYANNEPVTKYYNFPDPYRNEIILKSTIIDFEKVRNLVKNQDQDWTLHQQFLKEHLQFRNGHKEHMLVAKIVELRTAYRFIFNFFTGCYDAWGDKLVSYSSGVAMPCTGYFESIVLSKEKERIPVFTAKPEEFFEGFIKDFLIFIWGQEYFKKEFLDQLTAANANQGQITQMIKLFSNAEIAEIPWPKRELLLQAIAAEDIGGETEDATLRLVTYLPQSDHAKLLTALTTTKDLKNEKVLLSAFLGGKISGLNGEHFYAFANTIHSYASETREYSKEFTTTAKNQREHRYFSFNPQFLTYQMLQLEVKDNGEIRLASRVILTPLEIEAVDLKDPYACVSLHLENDKNTPQFSFDEDQIINTSGVMAYALCTATASDKDRISGMLALNTVFLVVSCGQLNAALAAGSVGGVVWAGSDIALGIGAIIVDTKLRDEFKSDNAKKILVWWDVLNGLYAGVQITRAIYLSAKEAKVAAQLMKGTQEGSSDAAKAILKESEAQADNVIKTFEEAEKNGVTAIMKFVPSGAADVDVLAHSLDLAYVYKNSVKSSIGATNAAKVENALGKCAPDVVAKFEKNPELLFKLGNVDEAADVAAMQTRLEQVAAGKTIGVLEAGGKSVGGVESATLFSNVKNNYPGLYQKFSATLDEAGKQAFLNAFKGNPAAVPSLAGNSAELFDIWNAHRTIKNVNLLKGIKNSPLLYANLTGTGTEVSAKIKTLFSGLDDATKSSFLNNFKNTAGPDLTRLGENNGALLDLWKANQTIKNVDLLASMDKSSIIFAEIRGSAAFKSKFDLLDDALKIKFLDDYANVPSAVAKRIVGNANFEEAWRMLDAAGERVMCRNVEEVERIASELSNINAAGGYRAWKNAHISAADFDELLPATSVSRSSGKRVINGVKDLVNETKSLVISARDNSALRQLIDDYMAAYTAGNSARQGQLGEDIAEMLAKEVTNVEVLNVKINNSGHGFDVVQFENGVESPTRIRMLESKPMSGNAVELPSTNTGAQMSAQWQRAKIDEMLASTDVSIRELGEVLDTHPQLIERYVLAIDKELQQVVIIKLDNF